MTARSFTEALTAGDAYADAEPFHTTRCTVFDDEPGDCDCVASTIAELIAQRDSARSIAAALEGQAAAVDARIKHWDATLGDNDYMLPRWVAADLRMAMGMSFDEACAVAALTGGEAV